MTRLLAISPTGPKSPYLNPLGPPPGRDSVAKRLVRVSVRNTINVTGLRLQIIVVMLSCLLVSCEAPTNYIPAITPQMVTAKSGQYADLAMLREGRTLFAHRCIDCHALPALWHYSTDDWPEIVNSMSHRASLKPAERDAIVAYILAVRAK